MTKPKPKIEPLSDFMAGCAIDEARQRAKDHERKQITSSDVAFALRELGYAIVRRDPE